MVARHPKAQQKAREGMSAILDQGDLLLSTPAAAHTSLNSNSNLNSVLSSTAQQQLGAAGAGRRGRVLQASGQGMQREGDAGSSEEPEGERLGLRRRLLAAAAQLLGEKDGVGSGNSHGGVAEPNGAGGDGAGSWQGQQGTRAPGGVQAGGKAGLTRAEAVRKLAARQSDVQEADGVYRVAGRDVDIHQIAPGNLAPRRRHMRNCQVRAEGSSRLAGMGRGGWWAVKLAQRKGGVRVVVDIHQIAPGNLAPRRRHLRNCQVWRKWWGVGSAHG